MRVGGGSGDEGRQRGEHSRGFRGWESVPAFPA